MWCITQDFKLEGQAFNVALRLNYLFDQRMMSQSLCLSDSSLKWTVSLYLPHEVSVTLFNKCLTVPFQTVKF